MNKDIWKDRFYAVCFIIGVLVLGYIVLRALSYVKIVVIILAVSTILAYILAPAVRFFNSPIILTLPEHITVFKKKIKLFRKKEIVLKKEGFSKVFSILIIYILLLVLLMSAASYAFPKIVFEFQHFQNNLPALADKVNDSLDELTQWLNSKLPSYFTDTMLPKLTDDLTAYARDIGLSAFRHTIPFMFKIFSDLAIILIVPLVTFYILMDTDKYKRGFMALVPAGKKEDVSELFKKIDLMLGRFIRGQLIVCFCIGVSVTIVLNLWGIQYSYLIGIFSGIIDIIPYVGVVMGMIPAVLLALLKSPWIALGVFATLIVLHWSEGHIIIPLVVGSVVGLPPLFIITALLAGAELMGIPGMFFAVPAAAVIRVIIIHYLDAGK